MVSSTVKFSLLLSIPVALVSAAVDFSVQASTILDAAQTFSGAYKITNVATGKVLAFSDNNFYTTTSGTVHLQHASSQGFSGTIISDGSAHCASAQWGFQKSGPQSDHAAVGYTCDIGSYASHGTGTVDLTKQLWSFVPCGSSSSSSSSSSSVEFAVKVKNNVKTTTSKASSPAKTATAKKSTTSVNPKDRSTWVCQHPGWWLAEHKTYVTVGGHIECKDELASYLASHSRKSKRFHHAELAAAIEKRASTTYCIVTINHLTDMTTKAIDSSVIGTFGGWTSQSLVDLVKTSTSQQWIVESA